MWCRLHINVYVSALVMIKEKVIKSIPTEITSWFANWNDDRKFHPVAGMLLHLNLALWVTAAHLLLTPPSVCSGPTSHHFPQSNAGLHQ